MATKRDPKPAKRDPKPGKAPAEAKRTRPGAFLLYLSPEERARLEATRARIEAEETARHGIRRAVALADVVRMALAKFMAPAQPLSISRGRVLEDRVIEAVRRLAPGYARRAVPFEALRGALPDVPDHDLALTVDSLPLPLEFGSVDMTDRLCPPNPSPETRRPELNR